MTVPSYDQLPISPDKPPRSAWGLWGAEDEVGAINLLDGSCVLRGISSVRSGEVFPLNWPLEEPSPPFYGRQPIRHQIFPILEDANDDSYDDFFPQGSSQWDGLSHIGHPEYGYYNGRKVGDFTGKEGTKNGIEHWARRGIVGRGVLLDVARYMEAQGRHIDGGARLEISVQDLEAVREWAGVTYETGDILLVRTGWMAWYEKLTLEERVDLAEDSFARLRGPGLAAGESMERYLWDMHFSGVAADNSTLEAWPPSAVVAGEMLHVNVMALLGIPIGELWFLEDLSRACAADGRWDFLLTSAPLNKLGGVGSPANAIAVR